MLEAGYRFARYFTAGAFFQLGSPILVTTGPGLAAAECHQTGMTSCSGNLALRLGLRLLFTFMPDSTFQPWLGVGAGLERAVYVLKDSRGGTVSVDYAGWELFNVQLGLDVQATPGLNWGPYVALSGAQYSSIDGARGLDDRGRATHTLDNPKLHEWLQFGLRVRLGA